MISGCASHLARRRGNSIFRRLHALPPAISTSNHKTADGVLLCHFVQCPAVSLSRNPGPKNWRSSMKVCGMEQRRYQSNGADKGNEDEMESKEETSQHAITGEGTTDLGIPGAQKGGKKLAIIYTCNVCGTRSAKQFTENAYNNGVVIVQCPGCNNRHLIADNLGFFSEEDGGWNIEKAMERMGENVQAVNDDNVLELSVEDVYGDQAIENATKKS
mmetsp:Transcript_5083/g.12130  ORF Transcript_5083/g.12130 Transcript_5083/m.12130 type:complete len:216 (+) Transcript_5083:70-717(+)